MLAQGFTHLGQRENNEDYFLVEQDHNLFIVADGMGGHNAGEVASTLAATSVKEFIINAGSEHPLQTIEEAVQTANCRVLAQASLGTAREGMGTTLTVVWVVGAIAYIAHVGDSRAYLIRDGSIDRITSDHSLVQAMVENGGLSESEARHHPKRNILTRAIGTESQAKVDVKTVLLRDNDRLLLCTDGLTGTLGDKEILGLIESSSSEEEASRLLVNTAAEKGSQDNITAVVITANFK